MEDLKDLEIGHFFFLRCIYLKGKIPRGGKSHKEKVIVGSRGYREREGGESFNLLVHSLYACHNQKQSLGRPKAVARNFIWASHSSIRDSNA